MLFILESMGIKVEEWRSLFRVYLEDICDFGVFSSFASVRLTSRLKELMEDKLSLAVGSSSKMREISRTEVILWACEKLGIEQLTLRDSSEMTKDYMGLILGISTLEVLELFKCDLSEPLDNLENREVAPNVKELKFYECSGLTLDNTKVMVKKFPGLTNLYFWDCVPDQEEVVSLLEEMGLNVNSKIINRYEDNKWCFWITMRKVPTGHPQLQQ